ncbi:MAG TPA: hypothetical protein EYN66_10855 [Myxococcales bacterium]|nr:hypothetical protein [Myxococcales bacterium]
MLRTLTLVLVLFLAGCGEPLPADVEDYANSENCFQMNAELIAPTEDDPHEGFKNVYACNITPEDLISESGAPIFPYPPNTLIVKESRKETQDYVWLIATAKKTGGTWEWAEYTRNFANEEFIKIPAPASVCTDCHKKAKAADYIFTVYTSD